MPATITGSQNGTVGLINALTAQNSTSGTAVSFTGIPSGVKRITMMLNGVSTNGTAAYLVQIGSGSYATTGYSGSGSSISGTSSSNSIFTTGFGISQAAANNTLSGLIVIGNVSGNIWAGSGLIGNGVNASMFFCAASITLAGTLDRIQLTTTTGTDIFDAGSINVLYE